MWAIIGMRAASMFSPTASLRGSCFFAAFSFSRAVRVSLRSTASTASAKATAAAVGFCACISALASREEGTSAFMDTSTRRAMSAHSES